MSTVCVVERSIVGENDVRVFYDNALHCYQAIMGDRWHHGDPEAEASGLSVVEACERLEERVVSIARLEPGGRALDFGSGIGGPTLHMAKVSGASFVGVTNNEALNQRAREKAVEAGLSDRVCFLSMGDTDYKNLLAFADASFDAVTFYESVCHLPDKAAFFRAAFRVLKPGGRLVGTDWLQRPFGDFRTEEQIMTLIEPVNAFICLPGLGTVEGYRGMIEGAGFRVESAADMFANTKCWGSTPTTQRAQWLEYQGPAGEMFRNGKVALDAARAAGVFTVGMFAAAKRS